MAEKAAAGLFNRQARQKRSWEQLGRDAIKNESRGLVKELNSITATALLYLASRILNLDPGYRHDMPLLIHLEHSASHVCPEYRQLIPSSIIQAKS
jgi:hypothetical protein